MKIEKILPKQLLQNVHVYSRFISSSHYIQINKLEKNILLSSALSSYHQVNKNIFINNKVNFSSKHYFSSYMTPLLQNKPSDNVKMYKLMKRYNNIIEHHKEKNIKNDIDIIKIKNVNSLLSNINNDMISSDNNQKYDFFSKYISLLATSNTTNKLNLEKKTEFNRENNNYDYNKRTLSSLSLLPSTTLPSLILLQKKKNRLESSTILSDNAPTMSFYNPVKMASFCTSFLMDFRFYFTFMARTAFQAARPLIAFAVMGEVMKMALTSISSGLFSFLFSFVLAFEVFYFFLQCYISYTFLTLFFTVLF